MLRQLNAHHQVVIPKDYIKILGLSPSDYVEVHLKEGTIEIRPVSLESGYSTKEIAELKRLFNSPKNRGKRMSAEEFKKHLKQHGN